MTHENSTPHQPASHSRPHAEPANQNKDPYAAMLKRTLEDVREQATQPLLESYAKQIAASSREGESPVDFAREAAAEMIGTTRDRMWRTAEESREIRDKKPEVFGLFHAYVLGTMDPETRDRPGPLNDGRTNAEHFGNLGALLRDAMTLGVVPRDEREMAHLYAVTGLMVKQGFDDLAGPHPDPSRLVDAADLMGTALMNVPGFDPFKAGLRDMHRGSVLVLAGSEVADMQQSNKYEVPPYVGGVGTALSAAESIMALMSMPAAVVD